MTLEARFRRNLSMLRRSRQLTQEALAYRADVSVSYISMLERGVRSPPLETVEALAKALGVSPTTMLE